jgi:hypothetical protein
MEKRLNFVNRQIKKIRKDINKRFENMNRRFEARFDNSNIKARNARIINN